MTPTSLRVQIANAPCSWGVLEFEEQSAAGYDYTRVLDEMRGAGLARAFVAAAESIERLHRNDRQIDALEHQHCQTVLEDDPACLLTPMRLVLGHEHGRQRSHANRDFDMHH